MVLSRLPAHSSIPQAVGGRTGRSLFPFEISEMLDKELSTAKWTTECTEAYIKTIRTFVEKNIIDPLVKARTSRGMFDAFEKPDDWDEDMDLSMGADGMCRHAK